MCSFGRIHVGTRGPVRGLDVPDRASKDDGVDRIAFELFDPPDDEP